MKITERTGSSSDIESDIQHLREWLSKMPHLPKNISDDLLSAFIYRTKSLEKAKRKIDAFCTERSKYPEYFGFPFRDPLSTEFKESCKYTNIFYLPKDTPEGYKIMMICGFNSDKFDNELFNARFAMMYELEMLMWPSSPGTIVLVDAKGSNASIIPKLNISNNMTTAKYYESALPVGVKRVAVFNSTPVAEFIINGVIKHIFPKKISSRFEVTAGDEKILEKYFPLALLPKDYNGGTALPIETLNEQWRKLLEEKREWFLETSKLCSDETKRPPDTQNKLGIDGSFKYLVLD